MNIFKKHVEYLKDNPEGYWFKRKLYGWGWTPATWQGWLVVAIFILYLTVGSLGLGSNPVLGDMSTKLFVWKIVLSVALLIMICYKKGEKPKWQWGREEK